ncbi:MAG: transcription termination/antitermination protein NusA [Nitrospina sp.]|nr:transcription termination/antitermination protein NusA [Nitrospina sp.]
MNLEILNIIDLLCREKGIEREVLIDALKTAVEAAARKKLPHIETLQGRFNEETGEIEILTEKTVVTSVEDPEVEIDLKQAAKIVPTAELGEKVLAPLELENLGRIAAQLAKQVILQRVRDAEIEIVFNEYKNKKGDIINGIVQRMEHGDIIVDLGKAEGVLPRREQVFRESFNRGERIRAFVLDVRKTSKNALVILSRTHVGLIKRLFELEVPEIGEGMVEIMGIVREPNGRTKIAVRSTDREIDAVGACVGMRGMRVQSIVQELRGEKIDIVEYSEDAETFIRNALSPAKISRIILDRENRSMTIIVADDQMSLAIGKKGQNVRLAAKLVKWKIDIKGESESVGLDFAQAFLSKKPVDTGVDFLELLKNAKGFGDKIVALLFAQNVVTLEQVLGMGIQGLTEIPGIGPKKAEAIYEFALANKPEEAAPEKKPAPTEAEPDDSLVYTSPSITSSSSSLFDTAMAAAVKEAESKAASAETPAETDETAEAPVSDTEEDESTSAAEDAVEGVEEEEEQDPPVESLEGIEPEIVQILAANGFQTIPELSVTPLEELLAIEGLEEDAARKLLAQAQAYMENFENA